MVSTRSLLAIPQWLLALLMIVGIPLVVIVVQAFVRRWWPAIVRGEHNDVAGFLIAVVGVLYAVTLAFIVIVTWEQFRDAGDTVNAEAGALRAVVRDSGGLPEPTGSRLRGLVVSYADEVSTHEWQAMSEGKGTDRAFSFIDEMFNTLVGVKLETPAQTPFLDDALRRLDDFVGHRAARLEHAEEGIPSVLWWAIALGAVVTIGFALLFGVSNQRLHYLMIGAFAAIITLQIFVILVLDYPFSGNVQISPGPFTHIVTDFR